MNRSTARRLAPALVALALAVAGCSGASTDETSTPAASADGEQCDGYGALQMSVDDLRATPLDTTGTPEEVEAQVAALGDRAATVKADLNRLSAVSDGPVAAAIGAMNQTADALRESLTQATADAQEDMGPKVTQAQEQLDTAYAAVTAELDPLCPAG